MKMNKLITTMALMVALSSLAATSAHAITRAQLKAVNHAVTSVPLPEMPAKAVEAVTNADKADRQEVAVSVVRAVVSKHKAAAPLVVSALSKAAPELAALVAAAASQVSGSQATLIAKAATAAAPEQAAAIQASVGQVAPSTLAQGNKASVAPQVAAGNSLPSAPSSTLAFVSTPTSGSVNQIIPFDAPLNSPQAALTPALTAGASSQPRIRISGGSINAAESGSGFQNSDTGINGTDLTTRQNPTPVEGDYVVPAGG